MALVTFVFLLHVRSLVAIIMLPVGLMAFTAMRALGIGAHHEPGGIAIAIGAMIDAAIVMIENAHKHLRAEPGKPRVEVLIAAASEVGPALFFSLLIITVSFLPICTGRSGRVVRPPPQPRPLPWRHPAVVGDAGARADGDLRARADCARTQEPGEPRPDRVYRPVIRWVLRRGCSPSGWRWWHWSPRLARAAVGVRVHARAGRGTICICPPPFRSMVPRRQN